MKRVLVLRDPEAARETVRELERRGHAAVVVPVQEIVALDEPPPAGDFACICVTSRNAVPALRRGFAGTQRPLLAVGEATAAALRAAGFARVEAGSGEAAALVRPAAALASRLRQPVLLALGRTRTPALEDGLARAGTVFAVWETYETRLLHPTERQVEAAFGGRAPDAVMLLSGSQAEGFARLFRAQPRLFRPLPQLLCLSERIAEALPAELRGAAPISLCRDMPALFDRLEQTSFASDGPRAGESRDLPG
ncbi:uroporphyrinogen-III synthase [Aureimonas leprariae]|uniref:Tetrapyrrole biosynthesis uroporphyrinogen III synthase domain-containing protein n=1 Tax=Plantimonas leprariae TaxID=2615207 RepID=A0A7V7PRM9_9HYPH|nr:uroporphyrinogen-III synthase [Aureimonas leprariae]KAB0681434.1 hypothetical protein F6X38_06005 [Aureimonas leprariae]